MIDYNNIPCWDCKYYDNCGWKAIKQYKYSYHCYAHNAVNTDVKDIEKRKQKFVKLVRNEVKRGALRDIFWISYKKNG